MAELALVRVSQISSAQGQQKRSLRDFPLMACENLGLQQLLKQADPHLQSCHGVGTRALKKQRTMCPLPTENPFSLEQNKNRKVPTQPPKVPTKLATSCFYLIIFQHGTPLRAATSPRCFHRKSDLKIRALPDKAQVARSCVYRVDLPPHGVTRGGPKAPRIARFSKRVRQPCQRGAPRARPLRRCVARCNRRPIHAKCPCGEASVLRRYPVGAPDRAPACPPLRRSPPPGS